MATLSSSRTETASTAASAEKQVVILGSTGSIGVSALDVVRRLGPKCRVVALSANGNLELLSQQIAEFRPDAVCVAKPEAADVIRSRSFTTAAGKPLEVLSGGSGLKTLAQWPTANVVLSAVVGAVGLQPLVAALECGKVVALANKEALVMAGPLLLELARKKGGTLLPVDSEHSAIFQCLKRESPASIHKLILTASGGPFYRYTKPLSDVTVEQALAHPTWKMGKKITIDSATLMNKGLEMMEASILFELPLSQVDVVIHPQSIVHSLVEFVDGAMLAQLSYPDMYLPIQYAITYPDRLPGRVASLDLAKLQQLHFDRPDFGRFPCLQLAREAGMKGGSWPSVLNAADEVAVYSFLEGKISFTQIPVVVEKTLAKHDGLSHPTLDDVIAADQWARQCAKEFIHV